MTIYVDGYEYDEETGECLGLIGYADTLQEQPGQETEPPPFVVRDEGDADWVLSLYQETDAQILAVEALIAAQMETLQKRLKRLQNRRIWLDRRFLSDMERYCISNLPKDKKTRSLNLTHGRMGLRKNPGSIKVLDVELAVRWVKMFEPKALQTKESVLVSAISLTHQTLRQSQKENLPHPAFDITDPFDKFYIETGIKTKS